MSSIIRTWRRANKIKTERNEMKSEYGKKAKNKCPHCGKYSLFRKETDFSLSGKEIEILKCVRCGK